ncbi:hypothetical protein FRX31_011094 [Thalictrum thalictroides]|uniref:Uncharacterized protein n=1 Tax=Thalictrum thalictroides TaxID=46969 RepID=A0A7J6WPM2_THATH|nr:hypothetical protein FRX31_011094 [Thalictrum thalictroides]
MKLAERVLIYVYISDNENENDDVIQPEEEGGAEYALELGLKDLVKNTGTIEPEEGGFARNEKDDKWKLYEGQEWSTVKTARHYIRTVGIKIILTGTSLIV